MNKNAGGHYMSHIFRSSFFNFTLLSALSAYAQAASPVINYTDLISGPNLGGQNNQGEIVTIYGNGFGSSQGSSSVIIGNGAAASYLQWSDSKISMAIGSQATSGSIVVQTASGNSNGTAFTVRGGNIYFISPNGSDSAAGTYLAPWKTISHAKNSVVAGDTVYLLNGVSQGADDGSGWRSSLFIESLDGTASSPIALVGYPGAVATIGSTSGPDYGIRMYANNWVFSNLHLTTNGIAALSGDGDNIRVVGNDITCPRGSGSEGCAEFAQANYVYFYGNNVYGSGSASGTANTKLYHQVYFTTDTNHVWVGFNQIHDNKQCRGIQFHSSPIGSGTGYNQYDLHVFNNVIYNDPCDGINLATVDPSKGTVEVYNNIIYNVGTGPNPVDGSANYSAIYSADITNAGSAGTGAVQIYNNTIYNAGNYSIYSGDNGAINKAGDAPTLKLNLVNNIIYQTGGIQSYLASANGGGLAQISGSNNLWYGIASAPSQTSSNTTKDPSFTNAAARDFTLNVGSPAIDVGINNGLTYDFNGFSRNVGSAIDLGAYEYGSGSAASGGPTPTPVPTATPVPTGSYSLLDLKTPSMLNATDGKPYALGMAFKSSIAGKITAIRFYKSSNELMKHTGHIYNASGSVLATVTFSSESASGWQVQNLSIPLSVSPYTKYVVTVDTNNGYFSDSQGGLSSVIKNGPLSTVGAGLYGDAGYLPTSTYQGSNYFRDVVFSAGK